jgi:hypothetical protein
MNRSALSLFFAFAAPVPSVHGSLFFSEVLFDAPGADDGQEFIELISTDGRRSLQGLSILVLDGDGTQAGTIDHVLSLDGLFTGHNGLFLWRDSPGILPNHFGTPTFTLDFSPDLENGSNTFLLVDGFTGASGSDLDLDNDGVLDSQPWASALDGFGLVDGVGDFAYTALQFDAVAAGFTPDHFMRTRPGFGFEPVFSQLVDDAGQTTIDPLATAFANGAPSGLGALPITPSRLNIPEPTPLSLAALVLLATLRRRRRC